LKDEDTKTLLQGVLVENLAKRGATVNTLTTEDVSRKEKMRRLVRARRQSDEFVSPSDLRLAFVSMARLLANRAELGLAIDVQSLKNLLRVAFALTIAGQS
jgi:hypothetical protein